MMEINSFLFFKKPNKSPRRLVYKAVSYTHLDVYKRQDSRRPQYYDPESPYFGKDARQVYIVTELCSFP